MNNWKQTSVGEFIDFNPSESLPKNKLAKKIPMGKLGVFERKLKGYEISEYRSGPKFRNGDTLVAKITPCLENGKTAFVDILENNEVAFGSSEFIVLRENKLSDRKFIYYLARSPLFRERAISCMEGTSGRKRVNEGALKRQEILVPDLSNQQKIASVLSALDDKIELNNSINSELEQMAKTLYDYWFVQFDFPNEEGKPYKSSGGKMIYNEVLKREVPEGWKNELINDLGTIVGGSTPSKAIEENFSHNGTPWITPKDLSMNSKNKFITRGEYDVSDKGLKDASLNILPAKSVLMSSRAPIGYLAINRDFCTTNQGFKSIICNKKYSCEYVYYILNQYMPVIEANGTGSTFKEISGTVFKSISIIKPNKQIVDEFTKKLNPIFKRQDNLEQQNQELAQLRDWLLPMLMNGQVKVNSEYVSKDENLSVAAEPIVAYVNDTHLNIPANKKGFAKQVLAGKIVSEFKDDPNFTDIKFQKIQFLAEHTIEADLNLNYYYQAAGPYDNKFMHTIYTNFSNQQWFDYQDKKFIPLEKQEKIERYYQEYFTPVQERLNKLFELLYQTSEAEAEIIATLYAVWNNRIIEGKPVIENELIEDFYQWSDRKLQYKEEQLFAGLQWLKESQMEPKGFGQLIKKAKEKIDSYDKARSQFI